MDDVRLASWTAERRQKMAEDGRQICGKTARDEGGLTILGGQVQISDMRTAEKECRLVGCVPKR